MARGLLKPLRKGWGRGRGWRSRPGVAAGCPRTAPARPRSASRTHRSRRRRRSNRAPQRPPDGRHRHRKDVTSPCRTTKWRRRRNGPTPPSRLRGAVRRHGGTRSGGSRAGAVRGAAGGPGPAAAVVASGRGSSAGLPRRPGRRTCAPPAPRHPSLPGAGRRHEDRRAGGARGTPGAAGHAGSSALSGAGAILRRAGTVLGLVGRWRRLCGGTRFLVGAWWGGADRPVPGAWPGLVCPHAPGRPSCQPHPRPDSCEAGSEACGPGGAVTPCNPPRAVAAAAVTGNAGPPHPVPVRRAPVLLWHRPHGGWGSSACWRRALTSRGGVQGSLCVGVRLGSVQSQAGRPGEKPCSAGSPPTALLPVLAEAGAARAC